MLKMYKSSAETCIQIPEFEKLLSNCKHSDEVYIFEDCDCVCSAQLVRETGE